MLMYVLLAALSILLAVISLRRAFRSGGRDPGTGTFTCKLNPPEPSGFDPFPKGKKG